MEANSDAVNVLEIVGARGAYAKKNSNLNLKVAGLRSCYGIVISSEGYNFAYHLVDPIFGANKEQKKVFLKSLVRRYLDELPDARTTQTLKLTTLIYDQDYKQYLNGDNQIIDEKNINPQEFVQTLQDAFNEEIKERKSKIKLFTDTYFQNNNLNYKQNRYNLIIDEKGNIYPSASKSKQTSYIINHHYSKRKEDLKSGYGQTLESIRLNQMEEMDNTFASTKGQYGPKIMTQAEMDKSIVFYTPQEIEKLTVPKTIRHEEKIVRPEFNIHTMSGSKAYGAWLEEHRNDSKPKVTQTPLNKEEYRRKLEAKTPNSVLKTEKLSDSYKKVFGPKVNGMGF